MDNKYQRKTADNVHFIFSLYSPKQGFGFNKTNDFDANKKSVPNLNSVKNSQICMIHLHAQ